MDSNKRKQSITESGFTLVELVVVIAILGILAGIGYVGYGAYIDYANRAADEVVLRGANDAFSVACEEQGIDRTVLPSGGARLKGKDGDTSGKTIGGVYSLTGVGYGPALDAFNSIFSQYYDGNEENTLKYYTRNQIQFSDKDDLFVFNSNLIADPIQTLKDSGLGLDSMSTPMRSMVSALSKGGDFGRLLGTSVDASPRKNIESLCGNLNFFSKFNVDKDHLMQRLEDMGINLDDSTTNLDQLGNAIVMVAAEDTLSGDVDIEALKEAVLNNDTKKLKSFGLAALPMEMIKLSGYYQYNNQLGDKKSEKYNKFYQQFFQVNANGDWNSANGMSGQILTEQLLTGFSEYSTVEDGNLSKDKVTFANDPNYQEYLNSGNADKAMDGYLAALSLLVDNKDKYDMTAKDALGTEEFTKWFSGLLVE